MVLRAQHSRLLWAATLIGTLVAAGVAATPARAQGTGVVEADVTVRQDAPTTTFGTSATLVADPTPGREAQTFFRIRVSGVGSQSVVAAVLRLRAESPAAAGSDAGGRLQPAACGWDERTVSWTTRPAVTAEVLAAAGPVAHKETVELDLTAAITGDGVYCFALLGNSRTSDDVVYGAREGKSGGPEVRILLPAATTTTTVRPPTTSTTVRPTTTSTTVRPTTSTTSSTRPVATTTSTSSTTSTTLGTGVSPCLLRTGPRVTLTGTFATTYANPGLLPGTTIDARGATFLASPTNLYPVNLDGGADVCVVEGAVFGQYDRSWTWQQMHDPNNAGLAFANAQLAVDGIRIDNTGDGIRPRTGPTFTIRSAWLSYIRDDCVENDHLHDGLVDDSLFDGCYVGFSARPSPAIIDSGYDGRGKLWTIRNTLVRLQPMPGPNGPSPDGLGHAGFFKWHLWDDPALSLSPQLALHDNVFMAERVGDVGADRMGIPPGQLASCSGNVMVWLGPGGYPAPLPPCFTVTTDRTVWDTAVAAWVLRHTNP